MGILKLASKGTKHIDLSEDSQDWIEVKADISKRTFGELVQLLPADMAKEGVESSFGIGEAMEFQKNLFDVFVVAWSLKDENDQPVEVTVENYLELSREAAEAVDTAISEHFDSLNPSTDEQSKSEGPSKVDGRRKGH